MYIGTIRPIESVTVDVKGDGLEEVRELVTVQTPDGWEIESIPVAMSKRETELSAHATIVRRDGVLTIEGIDYADVKAKVPEGFQLLHVMQA